MQLADAKTIDVQTAKMPYLHTVVSLYRTSA